MMMMTTKVVIFYGDDCDYYDCDGREFVSVRYNGSVMNV